MNIDRIVARQDHWPVVIVILSGIEIGAGVPVAFGWVVSIVLVSRDCVCAEPVIG